MSCCYSPFGLPHAHVFVRCCLEMRLFLRVMRLNVSSEFARGEDITGGIRMLWRMAGRGGALRIAIARWIAFRDRPAVWVASMLAPSHTDRRSPQGDMRLNAMLGTVIQCSIHIFDLGHDVAEKQRIAKFFDNLRDQVNGAPNICHGPERFSFTMGIEAMVEVDLQVLWVPGKAQVHVSVGDGSPGPIDIKACKAWPVGNLWVNFRQRQLEEMRFHGGAKPHTPQPGSASDAGDDVVERYPDFTVDFEAGSPRFTMLGTSPGSPCESSMQQVPDLMDWLPMKYSEQFMEWVEEPPSPATDSRVRRHTGRSAPRPSGRLAQNARRPDRFGTSLGQRIFVLALLAWFALTRP